MFLNVVFISRQLLCQCMIIGITCVFLGLIHKGVHLTLIKSDDSCDIIEAKPFTGRKLKIPALKTFCVDQPGECFATCMRNSECRLFGVGEEDECSGSLLCIFYSQEIKDIHYFARNTKHSYYILEEPTCCDGPCSNNKVCNSETCECKCPEGYTANHCKCPLKNMNRIFDKDSSIMLPDAMKQVASGEQTWGIKEDNTSWVLVNDKWDDTKVDHKLLNFISSGKAGVWGLDLNNSVFVRKGINTSDPFGTSWEMVGSQKLVQIDSGSSGVVYGVNSANEIYCRFGITKEKPSGTSWLKVDGTAKYVSCGDYGCWAVRPDNTVGFREGVTVNNCTGKGWVDIPGEFVQLDSGLTGSTYAISNNRNLHRMLGICADLPHGSKHWKEVSPLRYKHVTVGDLNLYVVAENGSVFKFS